MKILVIGAHPDDEVLGVGGSIAKWVEEGHEVYVRLFTDNTPRHFATGASPAPRMYAERARKALGGYLSLSTSYFKDQGLELEPLTTLAEVLESDLSHIEPDLIISHSIHDLNIDHRQVAEATLIAARPSKTRANLLTYSMDCSNFGAPYGASQGTFFVPLTPAQVGKKLEAYAQYELEVPHTPNLRSMELLQAEMKINGGHAGVLWAERFSVIRWSL